MSNSKQPPADLELLTSLAKRFADRQMFAEADELFQLALRFAPKNLGIQLSLAQVRNQQKESRGHGRQGSEEAWREKLRRNAIDAAHFFGLAALYEERGKYEQAADCLTIALGRDIVNPYAHKLIGKIHFRHHRFDEAARELRTARRYNPFDRETAELLGRTEYEREQYQEALEATIDAFLLLRDDDRENGDRLKKRIRTLKLVHRASSPDLVQLFRDRREKLQTSFDRLEWQRERLLRKEDPHAVETWNEPQQQPSQQGRLELARRLQQLGTLSLLGDEQIFHLSRAVREERLPRGAKAFTYGSEGGDIYLLESGQIEIRQPTPYGTFRLSTLGPGALFGEVSFISRCERSGDAVATEDTRLLRLWVGELELLINEKPEFGVQFYSILWRGLANKLREANEQLKTFFSADSSFENFLKLRRGKRSEAGTVEVESDDKIQLFREQGLTGTELTTLANFSEVKRYPSGTFLFHEGDAGDEMYIVLEGRVMISKYIPGGGEEALAILGRGDFFGEMSLVDGAPRSADARAFEGPVTVISFDESTLSEVMSMDPLAALEFMVLMCRLICKRLREIDEKVTSWRIMSGARPDAGPAEETVPVPTGQRQRRA